MLIGSVGGQETKGNEWGREQQWRLEGKKVGVGPGGYGGDDERPSRFYKAVVFYFYFEPDTQPIKRAVMWSVRAESLEIIGG